MTQWRLGIDLGTSALKLVVLDGEGCVRGESGSAYPTVSNTPGQAEQDPQHWLRALRQAIAALPGDCVSRIGAISVAGQMPTLVCLDAHGHSIGPAITWQDGRADAMAAERLKDGLHATVYARTGMPVDGRYLAPQFLHHFRDRRGDVKRILSAKDYLVHALTGRAVTDPSTAAGYGVYALETESWDADLCDIWDLPMSLLPVLLPTTMVAGTVLPASASDFSLPVGIPVYTGAADSAAGAYAMTGLNANSASIAMGSSAIIFGATPASHLDPKSRYLLTPHVSAGWYGREMDLLSTGIGFAWLGRMFGLTTEALEVEALTSPPGARGVTCAPYMTGGGEQGALWDTSLTGVFHGLSVASSRADLARAYLEGVIFEVRRCLDVLSETWPVRQVMLSGRLSRNPALVQMFADGSGRSVQVFGYESSAAIGAAALAGEPLAVRLPDATVYRPGAAAAFHERAYAGFLSRYPVIARRGPEAI
ncbi:FGGY-family carbohydrate kinase [Rhizobium sp. AQ_MP]|uniref:xylulokinase n=1 Tax=Rhizobium sp. AQ_MP TaxID=2761536 RepID=UPI00163A7A47|nr:FGGY-family carbohydrate kinase [Rhizobium sp. AQ_MP]MBC2775544.1 FGGY-family carbohydrate kinase [Rhizobium sp. AQ_MP]